MKNKVSKIVISMLVTSFIMPEIAGARIKSRRRSGGSSSQTRSAAVIGRNKGGATDGYTGAIFKNASFEFEYDKEYYLIHELTNSDLSFKYVLGFEGCAPSSGLQQVQGTGGKYFSKNDTEPDKVNYISFKSRWCGDVNKSKMMMYVNGNLMDTATFTVKSKNENTKEVDNEELKDVKAAISQLNGKIEEARSMCSGISGDLNTIYGLDAATTAVSAIGTATAGSALAVGLVRNKKQKDFENALQNNEIDNQQSQLITGIPDIPNIQPVFDSNKWDDKKEELYSQYWKELKEKYPEINETEAEKKLNNSYNPGDRYVATRVGYSEWFNRLAVTNEILGKLKEYKEDEFIELYNNMHAYKKIKKEDGTEIIRAEYDKYVGQLKSRKQQIEKDMQGYPSDMEKVTKYLEKKLKEDVNFKKKEDDKEEKDKDVMSKDEKMIKNLGHARTGLMAASIATSGVSLGTSAAASVNAGKVAEKMKQCNTVIGEIRILNNKVKVLMQDNKEKTGKTGVEYGSFKPETADNIIKNCKGFDIAGINAIKNSMTATAVISGIGTGTAIAGTTTSAIANTKKATGTEKGKKLDMVSNIMAGITAGTSLSSTAVSGAVIGKVKAAIEVAKSCESAL